MELEKLTDDQGFIVIHRKIMESQSYSRGFNYFGLMCWLVLNASWKKSFYNGHECNRGQLFVGYDYLSKQTGFSTRTLRTMLQNLIYDEFIVTKPTNKGTVITICKYDTYQKSRKAERQIDDKQPTSNRQATDKQPTTNKEVNEFNKETNINEILFHDNDLIPEDNKINQISEFVEKWNNLAEKENLSKILKLTQDRKNKIKKRISEGIDIDSVLCEIRNSSFLLGMESNWKIDFDFVIKNDLNWVKIAEGAYRNKNRNNCSSQPEYDLYGNFKVETAI